jgi:outer membrane receptor for ferric coprogen and ferric-rhodotorulic acid
MVALGALTSAAPARAQAAPPATQAATASARVYAIAPGPLNDALSAFARQAGISLAYSSAQLAGARSAGLNGAFDTADGLRALLAGTGYRAVNVDGGIRIEAEPRTRDSHL